MNTTSVRLPRVPFELGSSRPWPWRVDGEGVAAVAAARSDLFIDPGADPAAPSALDAVTLLGDPPAGDFTFRARVDVGFAAAFDAGVLLLWADDRHWAKLCFEYSPSQQPMVVSVVTRGVSDDANAAVVAGTSVHLRVSRVGTAFAFHASTDGRRWDFVRLFSLDVDPASVRLGLEVQSPTGDGCDVRFDDVTFRAETLADLRDGS